MDPETQESVRDKLERAIHLLEVVSASDPEDEPYKSKYAARELLNDAKFQLERHIEQSDVIGPASHQLAAVLYYLGYIGVETDEPSAGEELLEASLRAAPALGPCTVISTLSALNQLGLVWSRRGEHNRSQHYLQTAETVYQQYRDQVTLKPVEMSELFREGRPDDEKTDDSKEGRSGQTKLEELHTLTLYYLAQAYNNVGEPVKAALYCHNTLSRQLDSASFDKVEWALNSATLSQFYLPKQMFRNARHHLAAATHVLEQHGEELRAAPDQTSEEHQAKLERYRHREADVARCWTKLGQVLLQSSAERLVTSTPSPPAEPSTGQLFFRQLELSQLEKQMPDSPVRDFEEARRVFLCAQRWIQRAKEYYSLQEHASDHVEVVREHSQLFKALIFFESDLDRQCKMYKRRVDLLEPVLAELNPTYYLLVIRQLQYELAEIYSDIAQCKVELQRDRDKRGQHVTAHVVEKINHLAHQSIKYFDLFLDTLKDSEGHFPEKFDEDLTRPVLIAYFHLGHLYNRLMEIELKPKLANVQKSIAAYQFIIDYCDRVPMGAEKMTEELAACREMARLLPTKMDRIRNAINDGGTVTTDLKV
ncbi:KIF-binding protein-like [Pollicipes pollicipes]|uniref:KIF-binding protein-like n=1 Tax=Pollicipes pollicipes TaxID=41117 RepID=UPI0018853E5B|nr:KIF-binding protein-like [Pollicipes pollicipes]XP_037072889.1 KIF-binding protein-like [Pollicipes pollicipes]